MRLDELEFGAEDVELAEGDIVGLRGNDTVIEELLLPRLGTFGELDAVDRPLFLGEEFGVVDLEQKCALGDPAPSSKWMAAILPEISETISTDSLARTVPMVARRSARSTGATRWTLT